MSTADICTFEGCGKPISKTRSSIACSVCGSCFHPICVGVSADLVTGMKKTKANIKFTCENCNDADTSKTEYNLLRMELKNGLKEINENLLSIERRFDAEINGVKKDIENCYRMVKAMDSAAENKFHFLEVQNDLLHRRLNQADIIINGLPKNHDNIKQVVLQIFSDLECNVSLSDISLCVFINNGLSVLVKFKCIETKSMVMRKYFGRLKTRALKLNDFVDLGTNNIDKRIYLNDHLSPKSERMAFICRHLRRIKAIKAFKLLTDSSKVKITLLNGTVKIFDLAQLTSHSEFDLTGLVRGKTPYVPSEPDVFGAGTSHRSMVDSSET